MIKQYSTTLGRTILKWMIALQTSALCGATKASVSHNNRLSSQRDRIESTKHNGSIKSTTLFVISNANRAAPSVFIECKITSSKTRWLQEGWIPHFSFVFILSCCRSSSPDCYPLYVLHTLLILYFISHLHPFVSAELEIVHSSIALWIDSFTKLKASPSVLSLYNWWLTTHKGNKYE